MASITQFASQLNTSARPNQFRVLITFPGGIDNAIDALNAAVYLTCQGSVPQSTIEDIQIMFRGKQYHEAGERTYSPWTCQIYNSSDFKVRRALEQWSHSILAAESTAGEDRPRLYKKAVEIQHLDRNGHVLRTYILHGAYPQEVGEIQLDFSQGNTIEQFSCTFVYDYFTIKDGKNKDYKLPEEDDENTIGKTLTTESQVYKNV